MQFRLRTLLIVLAVAIYGCGRKAEIIKQGSSDVTDHANRIEQAAKDEQTASPLP